MAPSFLCLILILFYSMQLHMACNNIATCLENYYVLRSYRDENTRKSFISHHDLFDAFTSKEIIHNNLENGKKISDNLFKKSNTLGFLCLVLSLFAGTTSSSSRTSTTEIICQSKYDVFLSFRGTDTRKGFTSHLCEALKSKGIAIFTDNDLERGKNISDILIKIQQSNTLVIILSENYADSEWCLDELVEILICHEKNGQRVLPVFYGVDPDDVKEMKGNFGSAFAKLRDKRKDDFIKVECWTDALMQISEISGWDSRLTRSDAELIDKIVWDVRKISTNALVRILRSKL